MSRKSNKPIAYPETVTVTFADNVLVVKGAKAELKLDVHPFVKVEVNEKDRTVILTVAEPENKEQRSLWGTFGAHVQNMIVGVTEGYKKQLEINGVGYGFDLVGNKLTIKAGYSHPVIMEVPVGIEASQDKNLLTLASHDKQLVGQFAAEIRKVRKPEPYKGKGIKYVDEVIIRKQGKQSASAG
ncbi:MAG: 50S ribosomal protein L6 [bacterium]|nr:50S ribosomal protein L6 [bacterium]